MSVEHMAMVFAAEGLEGSEKLLLLAYTNYTDPHGYCWPGEDRLSEDTGTSVSTVRRTKKKLIGKNLVRSVRRAETSNLARVNLPLLASMGRARKAYDDNEVERLSFAAQSPESAYDQGTVQSDLSPGQGSDLLTVQSDLDDRSDCSVAQVNLTCGRGQSDLQSISDPPGEAISRPSFPGTPSAEDGGTDGRSSSGTERNPGLDLLLAIGAVQPEFLLTGKTLRDQALTVSGMLVSGWTEQQLRQVVAGRPLPRDIKASVGAVVARRLRDAIAHPPPSSVPALPEQFRGPDAASKPTPTPMDWKVQQAVVEGSHGEGECDGRDRMCGRPTAPGAHLCPDCERDAADARQSVSSPF